MKKIKRYTYKSSFGDYGSAVDWESEQVEIQRLRDKLGVFEDNDWQSVKEDGLPKKSGVYDVTVENECGERRVQKDYFYDDWNNFINYKNNVVAWKNLQLPYEGE